jgi:hypothetical protein
MSRLADTAQRVLKELEAEGLDVSLTYKTVLGRQLYTLSLSEPVSVPVEERRVPPPVRTAAWNETYSRLSELRKLLAKRGDVSHFIVFGNKVLAEMATQMPKTSEELSRVKGVGPFKLEAYGPGVLAVLGGASPEAALRLCPDGSACGTLPPVQATPALPTPAPAPQAPAALLLPPTLQTTHVPAPQAPTLPVQASPAPTLPVQAPLAPTLLTPPTLPTPPTLLTPPTLPTPPAHESRKGTKPDVDLNAWTPSPQLLRYYVNADGTAKQVSPNSRIGRWLALKGYRMEDVMAGRIPGIPRV